MSVLLPDGTRLRRAWLREALACGWTPLQARYLCRAAEQPNGRYSWAPPQKPKVVLEAERLLAEIKRPRDPWATHARWQLGELTNDEYADTFDNNAVIVESLRGAKG